MDSRRARSHRPDPGPCRAEVHRQRKALSWRRDLLDGWTFHVDVPAGVSSVEASLDFISPAGSEGIYTGGATATDRMAVINWNAMLLYPEGWTSDELTYTASLRLPADWKFGTSLAGGLAIGSEKSNSRQFR